MSDGLEKRIMVIEKLVHKHEVILKLITEGMREFLEWSNKKNEENPV